MVAFLKIRPWHGALTAAETIARLNDTVAVTLRRQAQRRLRLVCHWQQDANGRLSCRWDIEPPNVPVPPH
jgi:hypothetical protein